MTNKIQIDMNSDVGESFGVYKLGLDEEVIPHITSANIACGFHAGDPAVMRRTVSLAKKYGIEVGGHPGFPDLMGFGRRNIDATLEEIQDYIVYQTGALMAFALSQGLKLQHVKPHGSLYNMAVGILRFGRPLQREWRKWIETSFWSSSLLRKDSPSWRLENAIASASPLKPFQIEPTTKMALWCLGEKRELSSMIMRWLQKELSRWLWKERSLPWMGQRSS
jgi:hypothetical protein